MQSSDRNCFIPSQSRADRALHMLRTVSSTDTCQLTFLRRDRRGLVRGTQEPTGALFADEIAGRAVDENRAPANKHGIDGSIIAVGHPGQPAVLLDLFLGVVIKRLVEPFGVDDHYVGAVADSQMACIDAVRVAELTGQPGLPAFSAS